MITIRNAIQSDCDSISTKMADGFFNYARFEDKHNLTLNRDHFKITLSFLMGNGVLLVAEDETGELVGTIGGIVCPWFCDHSKLILSETWWWVNVEKQSKGVGFALIESFMNAGKSKGATHVLMVTLDGPNEDRLVKAYEKYGFRHLEHHFIKEL